MISIKIIHNDEKQIPITIKCSMLFTSLGNLFNLREVIKKDMCFPMMTLRHMVYQKSDHQLEEKRIYTENITLKNGNIF